MEMQHSVKFISNLWQYHHRRTQIIETLQLLPRPTTMLNSYHITTTTHLIHHTG